MSLLIDTLSKSLKIAHPFLTNIIYDSPDISANKALKILKEAGLGVNRSKGLKLVSNIRKVSEGRNYIKAVNLNKLPSFVKIPTSVSTTLRNFTYTIKQSGLDSETGKKISRFYTVSTDEVISKNAAIRAFLDNIHKTNSTKELFNEKIQVDNLTKSPDQTYLL